MTVSPANAIRIGYARVSTRTQDHQSQLDALVAADCREVVVETAGTRSARPKLYATIAGMRAGDTLVIYKPDRVARSMKELLVLLEDQLHARGIVLEILTGICAGVHRPDGASIADRLLFAVAAMAAEMERDLISERTRDGLRAAAAAGRHGGRPSVLDADALAIAHARRARGESVTSIAAHLQVGRSTLYRALQSDVVDKHQGVAPVVDEHQYHADVAATRFTLSYGEADGWELREGQVYISGHDGIGQGEALAAQQWAAAELAAVRAVRVTGWAVVAAGR